MGVFHFESLDSPTQYNISRVLKGKQWLSSREGALFTDEHLSIDEGVSQLFEYKHLLGEFVTQYCPEISPVTYTLNDENVLSVYESLEAEVQDNTWILKPSLLNNGVGIKLMANRDSILSHYQQNSRYLGDHVLQRFIHPPHLLKGHKYSLRVFVILTGENEVYLYRDGYFNICRNAYDLSQIKNQSAYLTNEHLEGAVQGETNTYQVPTHQCHPFDPVYSEITHSLVRLFHAYFTYAPQAKNMKNRDCLAFFGVDFMLDSDLRTWLLEVNHGPCFPKSTTHALYHSLYRDYWQAVVDNFVLPMAFKQVDVQVDSQLFKKVV